MEGCSVSESPKGGIGTYTVLLISLVLPMFVMLCAFLFFIDSRILALTRTSNCVRNGSRRAEEDANASEMASTPLSYSTDLLDGGIEDIQVPPLCPQIMTPVNDENTPSSLGPDELLDSIVELLKTPVLEPKRASYSQLPRRDQTQTDTDSEAEVDSGLVPWDGRISWALKGTSVFDDIDEEYAAISSGSNILERQPYSGLWVFQYGLRYIPSTADRDVYRTVRIEQLPAEIKLNQVLPLIISEVYCARLANTVPIVGSNTAIITFITQDDALQFVTGIANKTITLPAGKVVPVHTPTYPLPAATQRAIQEKGYTRCLGVFHYRQSLKEEITRVLSRNNRYTLQLEAIGDGPVKGEVSVKMLSVKGAETVFNMLKIHPTLGSCQFRFLRHDATPSDPKSVLAEEHSMDETW